MTEISWECDLLI